MRILDTTAVPRNMSADYSYDIACACASLCALCIVARTYPAQVRAHGPALVALLLTASVASASMRIRRIAIGKPACSDAHPFYVADVVLALASVVVFSLKGNARMRQRVAVVAALMLPGFLHGFVIAKGERTPPPLLVLHTCAHGLVCWELLKVTRT